MQISIREFKSKLSYYLKNLPIEITNHGEVVARVVPVDSVSIPLGIIPKVEPIKSKLDLARDVLKKAEDKVFNGVIPFEAITSSDFLNGNPAFFCDKCNHIEEKLLSHWEDGEEFQVCEYCKKKIKRP